MSIIGLDEEEEAEVETSETTRTVLDECAERRGQQLPIDTANPEFFERDCEILGSTIKLLRENYLIILTERDAAIKRAIELEAELLVPGVVESGQTEKHKVAICCRLISELVNLAEVIPDQFLISLVETLIQFLQGQIALAVSNVVEERS